MSSIERSDTFNTLEWNLLLVPNLTDYKTLPPLEQFVELGHNDK